MFKEISNSITAEGWIKTAHRLALVPPVLMLGMNETEFQPKWLALSIALMPISIVMLPYLLLSHLKENYHE